MQLNKLILIGIFTSIQVLGLSESQAFSLNMKELVWGFSGGFGGSGVDEDDVPVTIGANPSTTTQARRAEQPLMIGFSVETYLNSRMSLALSHRRGINIGPLSSGVSFTGLIGRYYFLRPVPFIPNQKLQNYAVVQSWVPFIGLGTGFAVGSIEREDALDGDVDGSGLYFGLHLGVDYQLKSNLILRPEFFTSGTFMDNSLTPAQVIEYGLVCGFHFRF